MPPTMAEVDVPEPVVALALGVEEVEEAGGMVVKRVAGAMEVVGRDWVTRGYGYEYELEFICKSGEMYLQLRCLWRKWWERERRIC